MVTSKIAHVDLKSVPKMNLRASSINNVICKLPGSVSRLLTSEYARVLEYTLHVERVETLDPFFLFRKLEYDRFRKERERSFSKALEIGEPHAIRQHEIRQKNNKEQTVAAELLSGLIRRRERYLDSLLNTESKTFDEDDWVIFGKIPTKPRHHCDPRYADEFID